MTPGDPSDPTIPEDTKDTPVPWGVDPVGVGQTESRGDSYLGHETVDLVTDTSVGRSQSQGSIYPRLPLHLCGSMYLPNLRSYPSHSSPVSTVGGPHLTYCKVP